MKSILNLVMLSILVCIHFSCNAKKPKKVYIEFGCKMTIPEPKVLGEAFTAHQSLAFESKDKNYHMQAQIEFENQQLTIVGLNTAFITMFEISQIENQIVYKPSVKTPIQPKLLLGFFYAIFCPIENLNSSFGKHINCTERTENNIRIRKIFINKKEIYNIQYLPFKNGTKITFTNLKRKMTFTLIEDYRTNL